MCASAHKNSAMELAWHEEKFRRCKKWRYQIKSKILNFTALILGVARCKEKSCEEVIENGRKEKER